MSDPTQSKSKKQTKLSNDSFLEAIRGLGSATTSGAKDFAGDAWSQLSGNYPQSDSSDFPDFPFPKPDRLSSPDSKYRRQAFFERQKAANEKVVFTQSDQKTKQQISQIQEELKRLAASTNNLAKEIQVAAFQPVVNPGTYHISFFEKLKQVIREVRKRIDQSASWMSAMNSKNSKRQGGHYWGQVQKSGTKFMLSQERYMSNSAG